MDFDRVGLGDLIREMHAIYARDQNVVKPVDQVPPESRENFSLYRQIISELNSRELKYRRNDSRQGW